MSAETLREAAALMRQRAEATKGGAWEGLPADDMPDGIYPYGWVGQHTGDGFYLFVAEPSHTEHGPAEAVHIGSWHPDVALAVADWLEGCAERRDVTSDARIAHDPEEQAWYWPALSVAAAYLGVTS